MVPAKYSNYLRNRRILVVGGSGFIGHRLVSRLAQEGADIVSVGVSEGKRVDVFPNVRHIRIDLQAREELDRNFPKGLFTYVFNLGGYIDHSSFQVGGRSVINVHYVGTLNLLEKVFSPKLKAFIQIGSSDEYGITSSPQKEVIREAPISPYSAAKAAITHLIQALFKAEGFPGIIARLFLVYGPGQDDGRFIPQIIKGCLADQTFPTSSGEQIRDFCYVEDIVEGLILCALTPEARGKVFNLASGEPLSVKEIINKIVDIIGKGRPDFGKIPYRKRENMSLYADISKAKQIIGWQPKKQSPGTGKP